MPLTERMMLATNARAGAVLLFLAFGYGLRIEGLSVPDSVCSWSLRSFCDKSFFLDVEYFTPCNAERILYLPVKIACFSASSLVGSDDSLGRAD